MKEYKFSEIFKPISRSKKYDSILDGTYGWNSKLVNKIIKGKLTYNLMKFIHSKIAEFHDGGGYVSTLWSKTKLKFNNITDIYELTNNENITFFRGHCYEINDNDDNEMYEYDEGEYFSVDDVMHYNSYKKTKDNELFFKDMTHYMYNNLLTDQDDKDFAKYIDDLSFEYFKFGDYYIFVLSALVNV